MTQTALADTAARTSSRGGRAGDGIDQGGDRAGKYKAEAMAERMEKSIGELHGSSVRRSRWLRNSEPCSNQQMASAAGEELTRLLRAGGRLLEERGE